MTSSSERTVLDAQCSVCKRDGKGTYETTFKCTNCALEGVMVHSLTHEKSYDEECPRCGCRKARAGAYIVEATNA